MRCASAVFLCACAAAAQAGEAGVSAVVFVQAGQAKTVDVLGKKWTQGDGFLECQGANRPADRLVGRACIGAGDFRIAARLAIRKLARSAAAFTLGDKNYFGFAGAHGKMFVTGPWFDHAWGKPIGEPTDFMKDGEPFEFVMERRGDQLRVLIDGKLAYRQKVAAGPLGAPGFAPVRSTMRVYRFEASGHLLPYVAPKPPRRRRRKEHIVLDSRVKPLPTLPYGPIVRLGDGALLAARGNDAIVSRDRGKTWKSRPILPRDGKFLIRPERAMLRTRKGTIILIFSNDAVRKYSWDRAKNLPRPDMHLPSYSIRSTDEGRTWTDLTLLYDGWCGCIQDIIQTRNGAIVVPGQELLFDKGRHATFPYVSTDEGKTWRRMRCLDIGGRGDHAGAIEGTLVELRDGRLWMLLRSYHGFFYESFSPDQGLTWTDPKPSRIQSTGSPGKLKRLASGRLALLWNAIPNPGFVRREELSISFSEDDGRTWTPAQVIARNKGGRVSYPHLFEVEPGVLWISTMQGRLRVELREADFLKTWKTLVAFGDSTTAPRGKAAVYPRRLSGELAWRHLFFRVVNAGVPGDTTEKARARFERDVLARKPALVVIQFGINDAAVDVWKHPPAKAPRVPLKRFRENLAFFVDALQSRGAKVVLMTPNPLRWTPRLRQLYGKPPYRVDEADGFNVVLKDYAQAVRDLAAAKSVPLVDVYKAYQDYDRQPGRSMDELLLDGMHPNDKGHELTASLLPPVIAAAGRE